MEWNLVKYGYIKNAWKFHVRIFLSKSDIGSTFICIHQARRKRSTMNFMERMEVDAEHKQAYAQAGKHQWSYGCASSHQLSWKVTLMRQNEDHRKVTWSSSVKKDMYRHCHLGGGFKHFSFSPPIWEKISIWLIFFNWFETTNQSSSPGCTLYRYVLQLCFNSWSAFWGLGSSCWKDAPSTVGAAPNFWSIKGHGNSPNIEAGGPKIVASSDDWNMLMVFKEKVSKNSCLCLMGS